MAKYYMIQNKKTKLFVGVAQGDLIHLKDKSDCKSCAGPLKLFNKESAVAFFKYIMTRYKVTTEQYRLHVEQ